MHQVNGGYVRLTEVHGNALSVVNAARVSYEKESRDMDFNDMRLLKFLVREGHWSPFRHASVAFEFRQPLMVARQHWRYMIGSTFAEDGQTWNEASRRYVQEEPSYYVPQEWRAKPDNNKQGSNGPVDPELSEAMSKALMLHQEASNAAYETAIQAGIAPEQARLFLPAYGLLVRYRWVASWQTLHHFITERVAEGAQSEIRNLAICVAKACDEADKTLYSLLLEPVIERE